MMGLIAAAALLIAMAAPVLACDFNKSASTETHSNTAASNGKSALRSRS